MSEGQMNEYKRLYPTMKAWTNLTVQFSTFSVKHLLLLENLREGRKENNGKYIVLKSSSWLKAEKDTVEYCRSKNIEYDVLGGFGPDEFLKIMSCYKGLVFLPKSFDTCPRLVLEAKYLGIDLILNENVLIINDAVLKYDHEEFRAFLNSRTNFFWENIK